MNLGFYTRSVEDIREEQFERIAGKYSARVLLNLNNTENETYFKDTNFRYGVVEASNYEELEKLDLNQQSTYVQSNFDEKVSLDNLHLFQCNMNADTSIYVENSVLGGYYISHSTREYRNKYINEYVYDTDSGIFYYQVSDVSSAQISEEEAATEIWYFPVSEVKVTLVDDSTGETTDYAYVYNTADKEYEALREGMSESDGQAVLCITIQNAKSADENDLHNVIKYSGKYTVDVLAADCDHLFLWNIRLDGRDALSIYAGTADRAGHSVRDSRECTDNGYIAAGRAFLCRRAAG